MTRKTLPVSVRMDPELKKALAKLAKADKRSLSAYIEIVLEQHVKNNNTKHENVLITKSK